MAEMFLKLDQVDGESIDQTHKDSIEIKDWTWATTNTVKWEWNQGGQSTKVDVGFITVSKICDKASVTLYQNCVTGKHIPWAKITCRKNDGEAKFEYMILELKDVMVQNITFTGSGTDQSIDEKITLAFAEFKLTYNLQRDSGAVGGGKQFGYHIQKQQKVA
jgi:type VI secretion system secreted protein Hcp